MRGVRWRRDDRGVAAVEFALLFPVFAILLFGTISAGMTYEHDIALTQGVREGSRFAATLPDDSGLNTWLSQVLSATQGALGGDYTSATYICVAYVAAPGTTPATQSLAENGSYTASSPCFTDGRTDTHVQVEVRQDMDWNFFVKDVTVTLNPTSVSLYER